MAQAYRLATSVQIDSMLPRDAMMINPVINDTMGGGDPQVLVDEWAAAYKSYIGITTTGQITVKAYKLGVPEPNPPVAEKIYNTGTVWPSTIPREISLCLSFYSEYNVKRRRGRLYLPIPALFTKTDLALRPPAPVISKVAALAQLLQDLGGVDDDWSVWSTVDQVARKVTHWYVDDEWDIQRPRGLRATTRTSGTTSE